MSTVDSPSPVKASPASLRRLGTPGQFRLALAAVAAGVLSLGVVTINAVLDRRDAADAVLSDATPLLRDAEDLYVALARADAAASTAFLRGGPEIQDLRNRYLSAIEQANERLADLARRVGPGDQPARSTAQPGAIPASSSVRNAAATITTAERPIRNDVGDIAAELPRYTSWVEAARVANRQGWPVGAEYLRRAYVLMHDAILPKATDVYTGATQRLYGSYHAGTSTRGTVAVVVIGSSVLALSALAQLFLLRRTRRVFNVGLLAGALALVGLTVWVAVTFVGQQRSFVHSQRDGADSVIVLSSVRILALRSFADENLNLVERTGSTYSADFDAARAGIDNLLSQARAIAERTGDTGANDRIDALWSGFLGADEAVRAHDARLEYDEAVAVAVGELATISETLDGALATRVDEMGRLLDEGAREARSTVHYLALYAAILACLALVLTVVGFQPRLREFR